MPKAPHRGRGKESGMEKRIDEDKLAEGKCDSPETCAPGEKKGLSEDWLSLILGLFIFLLSLGVFAGADILGWGAKTGAWTNVGTAISPISKTFSGIKGEIVKVDGQKLTIRKADGREETVTVREDTAAALRAGDIYEKKGMSGMTSLLLTYLALLVIMGVGSRALGADVGKFAVGFTVVFWVGYLCWLLGHYAHIAATTPNEMEKFGISWALKLTGEAGYIIALIAGLVVGNFFPKLSESLKEATRPELYIKTAIVIMGAALGVKAAESFTLASSIIFRGLCAIVEAYLIYWALVYFIARKYFKFSREWAAPLASGISICGVSAAIATGGAIRARPVVPIMVSSLVVIFAVIELVVLPFMAREFLWREPLVAGAWMGLAVKTDGAAVASGAVTDSLVRAKAELVEGVKYREGWLIMTTTTVKMFIDIFIGVWAFILALIWCAKIEARPGEKVRAGEIWQRFPKFVIGYALTFFILLAICLPASSKISSLEKRSAKMRQEIALKEGRLAETKDAALGREIAGDRASVKEIEAELGGPKSVISTARLATQEGNVFRVMFFVLTFFTIGVVSNFKKLWEEGIGRLAAVYVLCLFGFIIWIGLVISWIFFHGVKPPVIAG